MKIKTQIFLGFSFILVLTLFLAGAFVYSLGSLSNASEKVLKENYRSIKASEELVLSLSKMDQIMSRVCLGKNYNEDILLEILNSERKLFHNNLKILSEHITEPSEGSLVQSLQEEYALYESYIDMFRHSSDRVSLYFGSLQRQNEILRETSTNLNSLNHAALSRKDSEAQKLYFRVNIYVVVLAVLLMVITGIFLYKIPQHIVQPIVDLTKKIKAISSGNYDQQIEVESESELGDLLTAFNDMSIKLREYEMSNLNEIIAQKSRIESIIKSVNDGLIILNERQEIILVNGAGLAIMGEEEGSLVGKRAKDIALENEVMRELLLTVHGNDRSSNSSEQNETYSNFLKLPKGENEYAYFTKDVVPVYDNKKDSNRKFLGYILFLKDVTAFKKSDEAKSNFIAVVSHELKTPLSAINMSLMLLQDQRFGDLNEEQSKITGSMKGEVQRLIKMVGELLDLSKVESGNIILDRKPVAAELLVEYSKAPIELQMKEKNLRLEQLVEPNLPEINVDAEKISWVLINFLTNAVRYSPPGGLIRIEVLRRGEDIEFAVVDKGPGIEEEHIPKVFNRFVQFTVDGKRNKSGLGLGLAISKEVIDEHKGSIGVSSQLGQGSRFYFKIPLAIDLVLEANKV